MHVLLPTRHPRKAPAAPAPRLARLTCAVGVTLALAACSGTNAVSQSVGGSLGYGPGDNSIRWVAPADRTTVDGVTGQLLDGAPFRLDALRGQVVVVNFWASDCGPCHGEAAALEQVYRDNHAKGVDVVGVDIRDNRASAQSFERRYHVTYPSLYDPSNTVALRFRGVPPNATPSTLVLDRQGRIAVRHSGAILYTQLRDLVDRVLAEKQVAG